MHSFCFAAFTVNLFSKNISHFRSGGGRMHVRFMAEHEEFVELSEIRAKICVCGRYWACDWIPETIQHDEGELFEIELLIAFRCCDIVKNTAPDVFHWVRDGWCFCNMSLPWRLVSGAFFAGDWRQHTARTYYKNNALWVKYSFKSDSIWFVIP